MAPGCAAATRAAPPKDRSETGGWCGEGVGVTLGFLWVRPGKVMGGQDSGFLWAGKG